MPAKSPTSRHRTPHGPYAHSHPGLTPSTRKQSLAPLRVEDPLNPTHLGVLMIAGGFPKDIDVLSEGMAIVACESGFSRHATSSNPSGGTNRSIWQIDDGSHNISPKCALDNLCSTRMANSISHGGRDWGPWACAGSAGDSQGGDLNQRALPFRGPAGDALHLSDSFSLGDVPGSILNTFKDAAGTAVSPITSVADAIGSIVKLFARLFEPSFWVRVGKGILGVVMLVFGIVILMKALLGVDLGGYAEGIVGAVGGKRVKVMRAGVNPQRRRYTEQELGDRAFTSQMARERARTRGEAARRQRFWSDLETARKERGEDVPF